MLKERFMLSDIDEEVVAHGVIGFLLVHRLIERMAEGLGISFGEFIVLMHLRERKEEINLSLLKNGIIVFSGASITKIIEKLVRGALITRRVNPASRREKLVKTTSKGRALIAKAVKEVKKLNRKITKGFSPGAKRRLLKDLVSILENGLAVVKGGLD